MAMKSDVEVITGFIGSGKTSFLNALIEGTLHKDERIVIIFLESGATELDERLMKHNQIKKIGYFIDNEFTENELKKILRIYNPHKVFIMSCLKLLIVRKLSLCAKLLQFTMLLRQLH